MQTSPKYSPEEWLRKYEAGELTPEEKTLFESWYDTLAPGGPNAMPDKAMRKAALANIWQQLEQQTTGEKRTGKISPLYWRAAAACLILLAGTWLLVKKPTAPQRTVALHQQKISTAAREVKKIVLPDSSVVWLNAASTVTFSSTMQDDSIRRVTLMEGEAFFDVRQDAARPFEVLTGKGMLTKVLGTSFDVRSYNNDRLASVAVATGKVQVQYGAAFPHEQGLLTAGQAIRMGEGSTGYERYLLEPETAAGWRSGRLTFDHSSLTEIAHTLERWYHVPVRIQRDAGEKDRYNARFDHGASLQDVLRLLSITEKIHHRIVRDTIWISGK